MTIFFVGIKLLVSSKLLLLMSLSFSIEIYIYLYLSAL